MSNTQPVPQQAATSAACGTSRIVGCRFSLHPMTNDFVSLIKGAIEAVDTSKVWRYTDDVSTCVRGREAHVFDVVKAMVLHTSKTGAHVAFNATFSIGCPGDSEGDTYMAEDDIRLNEPGSIELRQYVSSQFALYPMGDPDYMATIMAQVGLAEEHGTLKKGVHYASGLHGDIHDVFTTLEEAFKQAQEGKSSHIVMTVNMSINSPSHQEEAH
ncbi:YkoF family thiamine/hydroxymethylpyrimidine-binding protein [Jeotgalibacillus proteolyticus]|uniref:Thiamine-binding protein n=1 Tax=Jeotgalibacillus proteolyticus TaxID=2082395 RepID=A0A2S5G9Z9_9BACL|nr:YkoF family thiamine/hydroxymethylpyrimidine-binding protein [Jeotgalibacillus proteolyticus]PPA69744.1 thiamine-binding protein [Jeotgalibacillus proteolyticus]